MKRLNAVIIGVIMTLAAGSSFAEINKVGVVDLQKIMQTSPQMNTVKQTLEKQFKARRDKLVSMEADLKKNVEKFQRDNAVMSDSQKKDMQKKIMTDRQVFETEGQKYQQELSAAHNKEMEALYNKVRTAISKIAQDDKFDLIIQKDAAPYSASSMDVTDQVMKAIK